jgi:hypothetical protein
MLRIHRISLGLIIELNLDSCFGFDLRLASADARNGLILPR